MPDDVVNQKYDDSAKVTLAIMHYSMGLPFKRIELYQQMMGIPLPDATQFEQLEKRCIRRLWLLQENTPFVFM